jgi:hypothetical protein
MNNVNLNVGGLLGALAFAGGAIAYGVAHWESANFESWGPKMFVSAIIVGSLVGNVVWAFIFKR